MTFAVMRAAQIKLVDGGFGNTPWSTAKLGLYKAAKVPNPNDVLASYTLADFVGYAAVTLEWNNAYIGANGNTIVDAPSIQFQPTDGTNPNNIFGFVITDSAGAVLLAAGNFASPVPMNDPTNALSIYVGLSIPTPLDPNAAIQGGP